MPLTSGYGSCFFRHWPWRRQQKTYFQTNFLLITFRRYIYIIFQRYKVKKKLQNSGNQGFSYYFCLMIEGSGSIPLTNGSGSGARRPENIRIRRFRIRIRANTAWYPGLWCCTVRTPWPTPPPPSPSCWRTWARRSYSPAHRSRASRQEAVSFSPLIDSYLTVPSN